MPLKIISEVIKQQIEKTLSYSFKDSDLLFEALQAPGDCILKIGGRNVPDGNKRLAMLGDAVLTLAILSDWYDGEDTRKVANQDLQQFTCNKNLVKCGRVFGLERYITQNASGRGEVCPRTMADTVEALIGAVYIDGGLENVKHVMRGIGLGYTAKGPERYCNGQL